MNFDTFRFAILLALFLPGCATVYQPNDPTLGVWDYQLHHLPRGEPKGELIIAKNGDGHSVTMKNPRTTFELTDPIIEGDRLVSGYFRSEGYKIDVTGVFEGDKFDGQINAEGNVFPMTATRQ